MLPPTRLSSVEAGEKSFLSCPKAVSADLQTAKVFGFFFSFLTLSYKPASWSSCSSSTCRHFSFFWRNNLRTSWLLLAEPFVNRQSMMNQDQIQMVVYNLRKRNIDQQQQQQQQQQEEAAAGGSRKRKNIYKWGGGGGENTYLINRQKTLRRAKIHYFC